ncbi:hypothetical protein [Actinokineospora sp. NBRC 105648]|uniref:hypothetical protein n=1 Tax=Actinokineospora sp. NBRC 105648 TaxID=3032206 RepID=UPI00249FAA46|nr:hypothetical protein [Actinokineospora sp. NBRC 105648]GLZ36837.1 hypothetical protein Acsp05_04620 [Actinokineospora sp. NBRC 105648]
MSEVSSARGPGQVAGLVELGRALDRPPSGAEVDAILGLVARRVAEAPRPVPAPVSRLRRGVLVVSVAATVLAVSVQVTRLANPRVSAPAPTGVEVAGVPQRGQCAGWAAMAPATATEVADRTGWTPPSASALGEPHGLFLRVTRSAESAAMATYQFRGKLISVEWYPANVVVDLHPPGVPPADNVLVGRRPGHLLREADGRFYRVSSHVLDQPGGEPVDEVVVFCTGSRLVWTTDDGVSYAMSGPVSDEDLVRLAGSLP